MRILITADLHFREHWYRWLIDQAPQHHLVCIAGDLLDLFAAEPRPGQARAVTRWILDLAKRTRVSICSGNHDTVGRQVSHDRAPAYEWLYRWTRERGRRAGKRQARSGCPKTGYSIIWY